MGYKEDKKCTKYKSYVIFLRFLYGESKRFGMCKVT